jgi:hypothetical protein
MAMFLAIQPALLPAALLCDILRKSAVGTIWKWTAARGIFNATTDFFSYFHTVTDAEVNAQGRANNVCYVAWMQEALGGTL